MFKFIKSSFDNKFFKVLKDWKDFWRIRKTKNGYYKYNKNNLQRWKFFKTKQSLLKSFNLKIKK